MKAKSALARERLQHFKDTMSPLDGGAIALNFVNTLKDRGSENPKDFLTDYEDFLYWCNRAGGIAYDHYQAISLEAYCYVSEAKAAFQQVITSRFMLHQIFLSVIKAEPADEIFVREFNAGLDASAKGLRYESTGDGWQLVWLNIDEEIVLPLWIVLRSAAELLLGANPKRIKQCKTCGSLFLDRTKNNARRWCNETTCGRRPSDKRYYGVRKAVKTGG